MHPIDHISTALVYLVDPNKISGALYHLVATYSVIIGMLPSSSESATDLIFISQANNNNLAKPKSANLAKHSEFRRILDGLRSR